jgi:ribonuclease HI
MTVPAPHFLLFSEASDASENGPAAGRWRFVLEALDGSTALEAADEESETSSERLELLAIIRGLEALDQPSRVTLVTRNRNISRGLRYGLEQWRENDWQWERFGQMTPVKNGDLWRRIDQTLRIHDVQCRSWKLDAADDLSPARVAASTSDVSSWRTMATGKQIRIDRGAERKRPADERPARTNRSQVPVWRRYLERAQRWLARLGPVGCEQAYSR